MTSNAYKGHEMKTQVDLFYPPWDIIWILSGGIVQAWLLDHSTGSLWSVSRWAITQRWLQVFNTFISWTSLYQEVFQLIMKRWLTTDTGRYEKVQDRGGMYRWHIPLRRTAIIKVSTMATSRVNSRGPNLYLCMKR